MELFLFMTLSASLLIVAALILRPLTGRFLPRTVQMLLWSLAALRLLIPVRLYSPVSLFSFLSIDTVPQPSTATGTPPVLFFSANQYSAPETLNAAASVPTDALPQVTQTASPVDLSVWLPRLLMLGAVVVLLILLILHIRELRRCRFKLRDREAEQRVPGYIRVFRTEAISAPFVTGVLRPQIILPADLPAEELSVVLAHEVSHIRGLDVLKRYVFAAALCVNWFNPLVWLMTHLAGQDMEILCDDRALKGPLAPPASAYARALLYAQERRSLLTSGFKSHMETRILNILKAEKTNRFTSVLSVVSALVLVSVCVTQPAAASVPETAAETDPPEQFLEYFVQNERFSLDNFQLGAHWEDLRTYITDAGLAEDPVLKSGMLSSNLKYTRLPLSLFGYRGTATLYFQRNYLIKIVCDFTFSDESTAFAAYYDVLSRSSDLFGSARSRPNSTSQRTLYWQKNDTRFSLCVVTAEQSAFTMRVELDSAPVSSQAELSPYVNYAYGTGDVEWEVLQDYLSSDHTDPYAQQEVLDMHSDIGSLQSALFSTKHELSKLMEEYVETVLANASDKLKSTMLRLINQGYSFEDALLAAEQEQGLQTVEAIREQYPDLSDTAHRRLTICSTGGVPLTEIDLPNENYYELYRQIKAAFGYYEINCTFTYVTP